MQVTGLFHVAIKTNDLDATVKFYTEVLGMKLVHRPDFGFPGAWIAAGDSVPIIHIYAGGPALLDGKTPYGKGSVDHVSLTIKGWDECLDRVKRLGYDWRAAIVPGTSHLVPIEQPDLVNRLIVDFLDDGAVVSMLPLRRVE